MMNNIKKLAWYYILFLGLAGWMVYANMHGWRVFIPNQQQTWSSSGPGYHK